MYDIHHVMYTHVFVLICLVVDRAINIMLNSSCIPFTLLDLALSTSAK